jgi:hypothetical protein
MTSVWDKKHSEEHLHRLFSYVLDVLPPDEIPVLMRGPTDVLSPSESLWERLAHRIGLEAGTPAFVRSFETLFKPEWEEAAPGIHVQILALDEARQILSMLVRLDVGTDCPCHVHADIAELHLLHGVLNVDDRTLYPGDFIHAEAGSIDHRLWTETGCTCFLVTSAQDVLF